MRSVTDYLINRSDGFSLRLLLCLLWQKNSLDVRQDTTLGNGDAGEEFIQFLVITNGELQVPGDDAGLLIVPGGIAGQFENFRGQVLHDGREVYWCSRSDSLGVVPLTKESVYTTYRKL